MLRRSTKTADGLALEEVPLDAMRAAPWNPRTISEFQAEALAHSLEEFGAVEPVVLNADGTILGGHQRVAAARSLGWTALPAVRVDLPPKKAKLLNLALNKISGEWDTATLAALIESIDAEASEFAVAGFSAHEVDSLLSSLGDESPSEFPGVDSETDHRCPSCSYEWNGACK